MSSYPPPHNTATLASGSLSSKQATGSERVGSKNSPNEKRFTWDANRRFLFLNAVPSWLISMLVHTVLLLMLAVLSFVSEAPKLLNELTIGTPIESPQEIEDFQEETFDDIDVEVTAPSEAATQVALESIIEEPVISSADELDAAAMKIEIDPLGPKMASKGDLMNEIGAVIGTGVSGRGAASRSRMVRQAGGSEGSEAAVELGLKWLAEHQNQTDGGWSFDHRFGLCNGRCRNHGTLNARLGATAIALLPFLGAGQTHLEGKYKNQVQAGLLFLVRNMKIKNGTGSLEDPGGNLYSHGLGAIVLSEAYAMTQDKELEAWAQLALNFTVVAQDPRGGGWRYNPQQAGDTSAVGWQLMALKSGQMAYLQVPRNSFLGAKKFLDYVQSDGGAKYGYTGPSSPAPARSAVGLLCRMYLGWKRDHPGLQRGVAYIDRQGPSKVLGKTDMYYNYYATQVMRHFGGDEWKRWNARMRDWLIAQQYKQGHETGSWHLPGNHSRGAGRLYTTAMSIMILEVYYRHMPIYRQQASEDEFEL